MKSQGSGPFFPRGVRQSSDLKRRIRRETRDSTSVDRISPVIPRSAGDQAGCKRRLRTAPSSRRFFQRYRNSPRSKKGRHYRNGPCGGLSATHRYALAGWQSAQRRSKSSWLQEGESIGEIVAHGPNVMSGYYRTPHTGRPQEVIRDWLADIPGDIGRFRPTTRTACTSSGQWAKDVYRRFRRQQHLPRRARRSLRDVHNT